MTEIIYSTKTEELFAQLLQEIQEKRQDDPFLPLVIVVPNRHVEKYLSFELAQRLPVVMNVHFPFIEIALQNLWLNLRYEADFGEKPHHSYFLSPRTCHTKIRWANRRLYRLHILKKLLHPENTYFASYLSDKSRRLKESLAWELSQQLSHLFYEYRYHRPEIIKEFRQHRERIPQEGKEQLELLFEVEEEIYRLGYEDLFLAYERLSQYLKTSQILEHIIFFTPGQISKFHWNFLAKIAQAIPTTFYLLKAHEEQLQEGLWSEILGWAKASVKNKNLSQRIFHTVFQNNLPQLREREAKDQEHSFPEVIFLEATSQRREVEEVAHQIISLLKEGYAPQEIAVLTPDLQSYLPLLRAVFSQSLPEIPYNLSDASLHRLSHYAQGALQLLQLLEGPFLRSHIFALFLNPCFLECFGLDYQDIKNWINLAEQLQVFSGAEPRDFYAPEYSAEQCRDWQSALERARLSLIYYPSEKNPFDMVAQEKESYLVFLEVSEELRRYHIELRHRQNPRDFLQIYRGALNKFLTPPANEPLEEGAKEALLARLQAIEEILGEEETSPMNLFLLRKMLEEEIQEIPLHDPKEIASGVSVAKLALMRPRPFSCVFILGLNDAIFPRSENYHPLDLRQSVLRAELEPYGDLSDLVPEEFDLQLFYDAVLCCRQKLFLSYCNLDILKDVKRLPSLPYRYLKAKYSACQEQSLQKSPLFPEEYLIEQETVFLNSEPSLPTNKTKTKRKYSAYELAAYLRNPMLFHLRREGLLQLHLQNFYEKKEQSFENPRFTKKQRVAFLEKCLYEFLEKAKEKHFPLHESIKTYASFFHEIVEKQIWEQRQKLAFPYGFYGELEEETLKTMASVLLENLDKASDFRWYELQRLILGKATLGLEYLPHIPEKEILPSFYLEGPLPFYYKEPQGFTILHLSTQTSAQISAKMTISAHLEILPLYLPVVSLTDLAKSERIELSFYEVNLEKIYKKKIPMISFEMKLEDLLSYLQKLAQYIEEPPDCFVYTEELEKYWEESHARNSSWDIEKIKSILYDNWNSSFFGMDKTMQDIIPFFLKEDFQKRFDELYEPLRKILGPKSFWT
ncbi:MAG: exodeoxyribonuclease V subunit gamma [Leptospiraceae bacterium]|nr:exodeoxyribonuclease V subunit gamma [Leptospiraceae bacterium]